MDTTPTAPPSTAETRPGEASPLKALGGLLLLLPLLLLPLIVLWFAGRGVLEEHSGLARYRTVEAVVLGTAIERRDGESHGAPSYVPRVFFRYMVDGTEYHAQTVTPRDVGGSAGWARRHIGEYKVGQRVTAYYDPRSPGRAFLDRRGMPALTATFFLPAPILALAVLMVAGARARRLARRHPSPEAQPQPAV